MQPQSANQDKAPIPTKAPKKGRDDLRTNGTVKVKKEIQGQTKHQSKVQGSDLREREREERRKEDEQEENLELTEENKTWARKIKPNHKRKEKSIKT